MCLFLKFHNQIKQKFDNSVNYNFTALNEDLKVDEKEKYVLKY